SGGIRRDLPHVQPVRRVRPVPLQPRDQEGGGARIAAPDGPHPHRTDDDQPGSVRGAGSAVPAIRRSSEAPAAQGGRGGAEVRGTPGAIRAPSRRPYLDGGKRRTPGRPGAAPSTRAPQVGVMKIEITQGKYPGEWRRSEERRGGNKAG